jgi:hypothetical protein
VFQTYVANVLAVSDLDVAKVDRMLHMLNETHMLQPPTATGEPPSGHPRVVGWHGRRPGDAGLPGHRKTSNRRKWGARKWTRRRGCPDAQVHPFGR